MPLFSVTPAKEIALSLPPSSGSQPEPYRPIIGLQGKPRRTRRFKFVFVVGVAVVVLACIFGYWLISSQSIESQAGDHCQELVTDSLTSPASAEFSDVETTLAGTLYTTTGKVDSQNKFGAMIRSTFRCESRQQTEDQIFTKVIELESN